VEEHVSFRGQLDALSKFLTSKTFDEFALQNKAWLMPALDGFDPRPQLKSTFRNASTIRASVLSTMARSILKNRMANCAFVSFGVT